MDVEKILLGLIINHFGRFFFNASEILNSLNLCLETQYIRVAGENRSMAVQENGETAFQFACIWDNIEAAEFIIQNWKVFGMY